MSEQVELTEWVKPDKSVIKLNNEPATIKKAESLGWERKKGRKSKED